MQSARTVARNIIRAGRISIDFALIVEVYKSLIPIAGVNGESLTASMIMSEISNYELKK